MIFPSLITIYDNDSAILYGLNNNTMILTFLEDTTSYSITQFINFPFVNQKGFPANGILNFGDTYYGDYTGDCIADLIIEQNDKISLAFFYGDASGKLNYDGIQQIQVI